MIYVWIPSSVCLVIIWNGQSPAYEPKSQKNSDAGAHSLSLATIPHPTRFSETVRGGCHSARYFGIDLFLGNHHIATTEMINKSNKKRILSNGHEDQKEKERLAKVRALLKSSKVTSLRGRRAAYSIPARPHTLHHHKINRHLQIPRDDMK